MKTIQKSKKVSNVITACVTAVAATFTLGYVLMPTSAEAEDDDSTTINMVSRNLSDQKVASAAGIALPVNINQNVISGNVMANASGILAINMVAGDKNQQVNVAVIGYDAQGVAAAQTGILQSLTNNRGPIQDIATTRIEGNAFSNASGMLSINQISGFANIQTNNATISLGIQGEQITDSVLAMTVPNTAGPQTAGENLESRRDVSISETAFQNASGVVQLNQTAGSHNDSANNFKLQLLEAP